MEKEIFIMTKGKLSLRAKFENPLLEMTATYCTNKNEKNPQNGERWEGEYKLIPRGSDKVAEVTLLKKIH